MGTMTTLINGTPSNDGGNISQMLSEAALMSPACTPAQYAAQAALQTTWNAYCTARQAALDAFTGQ